MNEHLEELRRRGAVQSGHFRLSSGRHSDTYLQCAIAFGDPAYGLELGSTLAADLRAVGVESDLVVSPALGGVLAGFCVASALEQPFVFTERAGEDRAMTLRRGQHIDDSAHVVVVEDVVTTGGSAAEAARVVTRAGAEVVAYAAVVDRSTPDHPPPFDVRALVKIQPQTWDSHACPLCADGVPVDTPGSRRS